MKICITGGAGFIAFHLASKLSSLGYQVVGFDSFNDYYDPVLKHQRAEILWQSNIAEIGTCDLTHPADLERFMQAHQPDLVVHLAAYAGVRHSMDYPELYIQHNIVGTHHLIAACNKAGVEKVVYASTSCVMAGNPLPWKESEKLGYQLNPYGYTKATNEAQFMAASIPVAIGLRFFTVYGPWGRPDMALFDFTRRIANDEPLPLFNNGDMVRDFTYVEDIVEGIIIIIKQAEQEQHYKDIYNIGNGRQVRLLDFVNEIEKNMNRAAKREFLPKHPADTQATWSDTTKLKALGYSPKTSIEEGVARFVEWYKSYYSVN